MVTISGKVTDFDGNPLEEADVRIANEKFEDIYHVKTDANGDYKIEVKPGTYFYFGVWKDYKIKNLEFWVWNLIAEQDLEISPRIDGIEVYGMHAFVGHGGGSHLRLYFRPMTLQRVKDMGGTEAAGKAKVIDVSPELTKEDIELTINGEPVEVLMIDKVKESSGKDQSIYAYLIQSEMPKGWQKKEYQRIWITLYDRKTKERGEGCTFCRNPFFNSKK